MQLNDQSVVDTAMQCRKVLGEMPMRHRAYVTALAQTQTYLTALVDRIDMEADDLTRLKPLNVPQDAWDAKRATFDTMVACVAPLARYRDALSHMLHVTQQHHAARGGK